MGGIKQYKSVAILWDFPYNNAFVWVDNLMTDLGGGFNILVIFTPYGRYHPNI